MFSPINKIILDSEIIHAKKLHLIDLEGNVLFNQSLIIDASGLMNGLRKRRDAYSFFGPVAEYVNFNFN